jgi:hypothetical protein
LMAAALKKAGIVDDADIRRAEREKREAAKELAHRMQVYCELLDAFPRSLENSMVRWMEQSARLIPAEVLRRWKSLLEESGPRSVWNEWSKWRKAWKRVQAERARETCQRPS